MTIWNWEKPSLVMFSDKGWFQDHSIKLKMLFAVVPKLDPSYPDPPLVNIMLSFFKIRSPANDSNMQPVVVAVTLKGHITWQFYYISSFLVQRATPDEKPNPSNIAAFP